jgi:hypothetical protein
MLFLPIRPLSYLGITLPMPAIAQLASYKRRGRSAEIVALGKRLALILGVS